MKDASVANLRRDQSIRHDPHHPRCNIRSCARIAQGLVPFYAILGMLFRAPVVYVFEGAECLIRLPPLPVGFAGEIFDRAMLALDWARQQGGICRGCVLQPHPRAAGR